MAADRTRLRGRAKSPRPRPRPGWCHLGRTGQPAGDCARLLRPGTRRPLGFEELTEVDPFALGLLVGLLVGEGHFGGDGKQPQITLRMHARHAPLFQFLLNLVPGSRLYGPYTHQGRNYYQWMVRGTALRELVALLENTPLQQIDPYAYERLALMKERYKLR